MKYITSFAIFLLTTVIVVAQVKLEPPGSSNPNFFPTIKSLEGAWVVTAVEKDDIGSSSRWMSEWYIKGSNMVANYKGVGLAETTMNKNWQVRSFQNNGDRITFQIVQIYWGSSTTLDIEITEFKEPVFRGHYVKRMNVGGISLNYRGAIELRCIMPFYPDPQIKDKLVGSWLNQGQQSFETLGGPTGYSIRANLFKDNNWLMMKFDGKDQDGIPIATTWFIIYAKQTGNKLRMTAYAPQGSCVNAGCGSVIDYELQWAAPDKLSGAFSGVNASSYLILGTNGSLEFLRR